ncbi:MAG: hypothetical protein AB9861_00285 [Methanosarcina sp.]
MNAIHFVEYSKDNAHLIQRNICSEGKIGSERGKEVTSGKTRFQTSLYYLQKKFEDALSTLNLNKNYILFIDGIDVRPQNVPFGEYLDCVKGLANATWSMNNNLFPSIKESKGRIRVVLLLRPDIFEKLNLHNQGNKLRDNSVLLDWQTKYTFYRTSPIFEIADNILKSQQPQEIKDGLEIGDAWDYYFPYNAKNVKEAHPKHTAFIDFLRYSLYRPRDIVTMMGLLKELSKKKNKNYDDVFSSEDFEDPDFLDKLSNYYMDELKDELRFHHTDMEYENFTEFFKYLNGNAQFSYSRHFNAFYLYHDFLVRNNFLIPDFSESADKFLQFLYDHNIICYIEQTPERKMFRWCFRERSYGNISPKVNKNADYFIHYGMSKAFDIGEQIIKRT